jgi:hypothetical protein
MHLEDSFLMFTIHGVQRIWVFRPFHTYKVILFNQSVVTSIYLLQEK